MPDRETTLYLAGELFSAKHLGGNAALAAGIAQASEGRYRCVLPQDFPQETTSHAIRDSDIRAVLSCDAGVFHYDGPELDSGTVVEFLLAKFADIPAILLRTDFRHGGDQKEGDPWNLMTSFFPRTETLWLNSMEIYHRHLKTPGATSQSAAESMTREIAQRVTTALDTVLSRPAVMPSHLRQPVYDWLALLPNFLDDATRKKIAALQHEKVEKGLL
jgi:nucleoside 2-deoxyribosyltransferase